MFSPKVIFLPCWILGQMDLLTFTGPYVKDSKDTGQKTKLNLDKLVEF